MIDARYKPYFLPQISMPFEIVLQKLDDEGVDYEMVELNPDDSDEIKISQGVVISDEVEKAEVDDNKPIWIADNQIVDGHHRYAKALLDKVPLKAVNIKLNEKDASRVLNKIQDIYEYEQKQQMEEIVGNDYINNDNQADSGVSDSEFLASLEEDNLNVQSGETSTNQKTIIGYRKDPINEKSVVGNFFSLKPIEGFNKYEIEFDNLLDTHSLGIAYKDSQEPTDILAKIWFPHVNFEKISKEYNMSSTNLKNKAVAEKAMHNNFDGIKYGDTLVQALK
jgi:hypothetical protein